MLKLKEAREAAGLTIQRLASFADVPWQSISNLENPGVKRPGNPARVTIETAVRLMEVLYPHLQIKDFVIGSRLRVMPGSDNDRKTMSRHRQSRADYLAGNIYE